MSSLATTRLCAATAVSAVLLSLSGAARADHFVVPCAPELNAVEAAINAGQFFGRNAATSQSNLLAKLEAAAAKISQQKFGDAIDKLQDISDAATALADASKPKLLDATTINQAVTTAIGCVGTL